MVTATTTTQTKAEAVMSNAELNRKLDLLLQTGCLLLESHADTERVLRNMRRTAIRWPICISRSTMTS